jgi:hypothetical protein
VALVFGHECLRVGEFSLLRGTAGLGNFLVLGFRAFGGCFPRRLTFLLGSVLLDMRSFLVRGFNLLRGSRGSEACYLKATFLYCRSPSSKKRVYLRRSLVVRNLSRLIVFYLVRGFRGLRGLFLRTTPFVGRVLLATNSVLWEDSSHLAESFCSLDNIVISSATFQVGDSVFLLDAGSFLRCGGDFVHLGRPCHLWRFFRSPFPLRPEMLSFHGWSFDDLLRGNSHAHGVGGFFPRITSLGGSFSFLGTAFLLRRSFGLLRGALPLLRGGLCFLDHSDGSAR